MKILSSLVLGAVLVFGAATTGDVQAQPAKSKAAERLVIYHAEGRRSERIVWLCEELGIPYTLKYRRGDVSGSFADIRAVNPGMAVAPTVFLDGELLMESGGIMQVILDREGKGKLVPPVKSPDYGRHMMYMHYAEGTLASDIIADYRTARATGGKAPRGAETDGQRAMRYADDYLKKYQWFGGANFTAADIMMLWPTSYAIRMNVADPAKYPNVVAWQKRVEDRPAFKRMLAAARPDGRVAPPPSLVVE